MKISYNWLKQFIKTDWSSDETAQVLTNLGLEVEKIEKFESIKGSLRGILVGNVLTCFQHPNADNLKVTTVDIGDKNILQIVCGASNVTIGQNVFVATIGTILCNKDGVKTVIKKAKIRDVESCGMICAEDEIGLGNSHEGIMILDKNLLPGTLGSNIYNTQNDEIFEIGLTPNRADAMSHLGTARDLRAAMLQNAINVEFITPSVSSFSVDKRTLKIDVKVVNKNLCPRYCGLTISGIKVKPSPDWLQIRLKSIGITPKNNIVDITNYVMHDLGQPLHALDASKISGKIIVTTIPQNTKFITLDNIEKNIHEDDLMICDDNGPLSIAGIFGGKNSAISNDTISIFLESAYFDPISIRKTAKRHNLFTDASFRFERGIDPTITEYALKRAAILIKEIAGGEISSDIVEINSYKIEDFKVFLHFQKTLLIIGQELPKEVIKNILASLDIKVISETESGLGLKIPSYRVDVQREIDVIEEILRVYGYNNINPNKKLNATIANSSRIEDHKIQNITANLLNSYGFHEIMSNSLTDGSYIKLFDSLNEINSVTILNPLSSDLATMRQSLLFSGLESISFNINRRNTDLKIFEFGKSYHKYSSEFKENKHLSLFITGDKYKESWIYNQKPTDFFMFKGIIKSVLDRLGLEKINNIPLTTDFFAEGMGMCINNLTIVEFGTLKKQILKHFDIKQEVFYADFNWDNILKLLSNNLKYKDISKYQGVRRDLSLLINNDISFEEIYKITNKYKKYFVKEIDLFDVYQGQNLPEGKKSYALSFIIHDETKTLTEDQIKKVVDKLINNFEKDLGAIIR